MTQQASTISATPRPESMRNIVQRLFEENYRPTLRAASEQADDEMVRDHTYHGRDGFMHVASGYDSGACGEPRDAEDIDAEQHPEFAKSAEDVEDLYFRVKELSQRKMQLFRDPHVQTLFAEAFQIGGYTAWRAADEWMNALEEHSFKRGTLRYALEHTPTGKTVRGRTEYVQRTQEDVEAFLRAYVR